MTKHLTPSQIRALFSGRLAPEEGEELLRHWDGCPFCRFGNRLQASALLAEVAPSSSIDDSGYETTIERVIGDFFGRTRKSSARGDFAGRSGSQGTVEAGLVELLLERSRSFRHSNPRRMVELAELAADAVEQLDPDICGSTLLADLTARTLAELANAYRVSDHLSLAEDTMARALRWLRRGTGDLLTRARVLDLLASLFASQRRLTLAIRIVEHLYDLYEELGDPHLAGRALIKKGVFLGSDNRPQQGLPFVLEGMRQIDRKKEPSLFTTSIKTVINLFTEAGFYSQARRVLWHSRMLRLLPSDRLSLLRLRWVEGRIYAGLGDDERAERAFLEARRGFRRADLIYTTALVELDLALLWVRQEENVKVIALLERTLEIFRSLRIAREAIAAVLVLREALTAPHETSESLSHRIRLAVVLFTELERQPVPIKVG